MISKTLAAIAAQQTSILWMNCAGLVIFGCFFTGLIFWTTRKERQPLYQRMSEMPFANETIQNSSKVKT